LPAAAGKAKCFYRINSALGLTGQYAWYFSGRKLTG
jgi:hypothetical protein